MVAFTTLAAGASAAGALTGKGGTGAGLGIGGPGPSGISQRDQFLDQSSRNIVTVASPDNVIGEILKFANANESRSNGGLGFLSQSPFTRAPGTRTAGVLSSDSTGGGSGALLIIGLAVAGGVALLAFGRR